MYYFIHYLETGYFHELRWQFSRNKRTDVFFHSVSRLVTRSVCVKSAEHFKIWDHLYSLQWNVFYPSLFYFFLVEMLMKQLPYCLNGSFDIVMYPFNYLAMQALFICVDNIISQEKPNTTIILYITHGQSSISKLRLFKVENFKNARILCYNIS